MDCKSFGERYYLRLFFDLMDMCMVDSYIVYKRYRPKGMELLDFNVVAAKLLIGSYNSRQRDAPPIYHGDLSYQLTHSFTCQLFSPREANTGTVMLGKLKIKRRSNVTHVEFTFN